jgi:hypothetical protein
VKDDLARDAAALHGGGEVGRQALELPSQLREHEQRLASVVGRAADILLPATATAAVVIVVAVTAPGGGRERVGAGEGGEDGAANAEAEGWREGQQGEAGRLERREVEWGGLEGRGGERGESEKGKVRVRLCEGRGGWSAILRGCGGYYVLCAAA